MATCKGCGGDNPPGAARCQYCDQPLHTSRTLELDWDVRTGGGASGRGRLRLQAPTSVGSDAARVAVEAAFGAAVAALGPSAQAGQVEAHMRERLPALLPAGCVVDALSVESVSAFVLVGGAPGEAPAGASPARGCSLGCLALAAVLCCLPWGLFGPILVMAAGEDVTRVRSARVATTPDDALAQPGLIALQGVVATVDSGAPTSPDGVACLWLSTRDERGKEVVEKVDSFQVGALRVELDDTTTWDHASSFTYKVDGKAERYQAIRADKPVLVIGAVQPGGLVTGKVTVSTRATRDELADHYSSMRRFSLVVSGLGLVIPALLLALWFRRGRR